MATYETSYASALVRFEDGTFTVLATSASASTATESIDDGAFWNGEQVTIDTESNTDQIQTTVQGVYQDGYVVYVDGGYVLFSNTDHPDGTSFLFDVDENGNSVLPVCFTAGTLIDTPNGPVAIEALRVGDLVAGLSGYRSVKWIGWRHYLVNSPRFTASRREAIVPVRIKANALADNIPSRDIVLSPWHHLYIDNVLIKANQLVNGRTVLRESGISRVRYFHIELDQFDVIRAHNVYSESWADGGNRNFFENVDVTTLHPKDMVRRTATRPGFNVLAAKDPLLAKIQQRIALRSLLDDEGEPAAVLVA